MSKWLGIAWVAVAIGVGASNPLEGSGLAAPGAVSLAIMLIAAWLWVTEAVPLFVTSFIVLAASLVWLRPVLDAHGTSVPQSTFTAPFASDLVLLFLGGFVLAAGLERYRLDGRLARIILARAGTSIPSVMAALMTVTAVLSMWLSNTAATALMLGLTLPLVEALPAEASARKTLLLSVPLAANVGGLGTPIGTPPNAIVLKYLEASGGGLSFAGWMAIGVPAVAVLLVLIWFALLGIYGGRGVDLPALEPEPLDLPDARGRRGRILVLSVAGLTVLGWLFGGALGLSPGSVSLLPVIVFFGTRVLSLADFRRLSWDVLFLMGGGLCLAAGLEASGLADWIVQRLPVEGMAVAAVSAAFLVVACVMSTVMSNTATANLLAPLVAGLSGVERGPIFIGMAFGCSLAMALPISTPPNAMAFASGQLEARDLLRVGLLVTVVGVVLTLVVFSRWWRFLGVA